jgi:opacity protein-like surface antigen
MPYIFVVLIKTKNFQLMKKLFLSLALVAAGVAAQAQIGSGSLMLGGSLGFSSTGGGENKATPGGGGASVTTDLTARSNWNFSPTVGYFLNDNLAVGLRLNLGGTNRNQVTTTDGKTTENVTSFDLGVELFGRYYKELGSSFYFFVDGGLGFTSASWTNKTQDGLDKLKDDDKNSISTIGLNVAPGVAFFPTEKWGIDLTLNRLVGFNMNSSTREAATGGAKLETGLHYYMGK